MNYYVNRESQRNGDHEVHKEGCIYMPASKLHLGNFISCAEAVREARNSYPKSNGCYYCAKPCHTS